MSCTFRVMLNRRGKESGGKGLGGVWEEGQTLEEDRKVKGSFGVRTRMGTSFQAKNGHLALTTHLYASFY